MEKFNKENNSKSNEKFDTKIDKELIESKNIQTNDDSPKIPLQPFDNMKWIFSIKFNEVLLFLGLGGSLITLLYLFGYSKALDFPIGLYINLQDYLNLSLYFTVPFILFIGIILLITYSSLPFFLFINNRKLSKLTIMDFLDTLPVMFICFIFISYFVSWLLPNHSLNTHEPIININTQNIKFDEISILGIKIKYIILSIIILYLYSHITLWFFKMYLKNNIITFSKYILYSFIPLYLLLIIFVGYFHGKSDIAFGKRKFYDIEVVLKNDSLVQAKILYPFDKYLIVCDSTKQIRAIKMDDIKSLGTIPKKNY